MLLSIFLALGGQTSASPLTSGSSRGHSLSRRGVRMGRLIQRHEIYQQGFSGYGANGANLNGGAAAGANAQAWPGLNAGLNAAAGLNAGLNVGAAAQTGIGLASGILTAAGNAQAGVGLGGILGAGGNAQAISNPQGYTGDS